MSILNRIGEALADPTRLTILQTLFEHQGITAVDLAAIVGYAPSTIGHHLRKLERAGLVERRRRGRRKLLYGRFDRWRAIHTAFAWCVTPDRQPTRA